jgi:methylthioribose-1-phosphate isomerase
VIDQTALPDRFDVLGLRTLDSVAHAILTMQVRGAPLIGVAAAYGLALGLRHDASDAGLELAIKALSATRPTAVNLRWALDRMMETLKPMAPSGRADAAWKKAGELAEHDVATCAEMAEHGAAILRTLSKDKGGAPLRILTHCNAGWLATVDWGTALGPIYKVFDEGIPISVWVDETRPRNQGYLTAWELTEHGVPCTVIADNAGGHYMQRGEVDACIVGSDRTTARGDVCNKIGTYLKALAAKDCGVPFYAAVPSSTIDFSVDDFRTIPIEERDAREVTERPGVIAQNPAFDVTPARLVTGIITEAGVSDANEAGLRALFPMNN